MTFVDFVNLSLLRSVVTNVCYSLLQYLVRSPKRPKIGTSFPRFSVVLARNRLQPALRVQLLPTQITTITTMRTRLAAKKKIRR